ncbi:MAG: RNA polymerase subunit sigma [Ponticaulis sp.]|nr:RNA polymerase subunit sigma [Ponticaulis sp.]
MRDIAESKSKGAFRLLFDYYAPRLKSFLMRLGADDMQAEEIVQEVMVTVWRKAEQYDPAQASPTTWIFRIARNRHIDAFRRQRHLDAQPDEPMLSPAELPEPEESYQLLEIEENVREALKTLPDEQVELVRASFYEGLSHSEIAERKQLPLGTVKSRIRLAFERLRSTLSREL